MKYFFPPAISFAFMWVLVKAIEWIFNLEAPDDSATPGMVFLYELLFYVFIIIIFYLAHIFIFVKTVDKQGAKGYFKIIFWTEFIIICLCVFLNELVYGDSDLSSESKAILGLGFWGYLTTLLLVDLLALSLIKKYFKS